jgi:deoxyribonuclease-4
MSNLIIGSHVGCSGKDMLLSSVKEALSYNANTFMFYTGAPQNTRRKAISEFKIEEAKALMKENNINIDHVIVHAPYIINLGNTEKPATFELAVDFLKQEIDRCDAIGVKTMVLHPGAHVGAGFEAGIARIIEGLNLALTEEQNVVIALETMAGKGTECGRTFEQINEIIESVTLKDKLGVCLDTCHIHDAGYNVKDFDTVLDKFDEIIGLDRLKVLHINDSKNTRGASKDRHENIGLGYIGFDALNDIVNHERIAHLPKILETPYIPENDGEKKKTLPPYKHEIQMFRDKSFNESLLETIRNNR